MHQSHERVTNDFAYHPATGMMAELHDSVRQNFASLAHWVVENAPRGYAREQAIIRLREAMMWTNAAIACDSNSNEVVPQSPTQ
ncbi:Acb2/Tad1 domain-containing protein [Streptomyces griseosporeus]|uniref:Acb2/Tad1 domain-containing protein n=1 Tax=Streptomyces griseosporeus TaxID=1910 RepID=UPI0019B9D6BE|nr:hypothetical protein GCM10018783_73650 [Streptomyces griseosporeus]